MASDSSTSDGSAAKSQPDIDQLFADLLNLQQKSSSSMPPVHLWNPLKSGDMDMVIDREGRWIHEGGEIKRAALVKLFSSILKRAGDNYFLVTPVEKWQITVDIAPFFIISAQREIRESQQAIVLTCSTGETLVVSEQNPLQVNTNGQPVPLVTVRDNLKGLLSRPVFYQLVDWAEQAPQEKGTVVLYVESMGKQFRLGSIEP